MLFQSKRRKGLWKRLWRCRVNNQHSIRNMDEEQHHLQQQQQQQQQQHQNVFHHHQQQQQLNGQRNIDTEEGNNGFPYCCGGGGGSGTTNNSNNSTLSTREPELQLFRALTDKLKDHQLETICQAIDPIVNGSDGVSAGGCCGVGGGGVCTTSTDCVLVKKAAICGLEPHVIACRIWRWSDLRNPNELKRIPSVCPNERDPVYVCCNPSHWSRLCRTETPPPPYRLFAMDRLRPEDRAPSEERLGGYCRFPENLTTYGEESSFRTGWCQLAYWEMATRVGRLFPVENSTINVFSEQPRGDGLCLTTLAQQRLTAPEPVLKTRKKIGLGVTISRENDGIWLYNRSENAVFVHSPTLSECESRTLLVYRVPPGNCLRAFDPKRAATESFAIQGYIAGAQTGPVDVHSVRISFVKGWGPKYTRQEVTACPCWLEILLSPCLSSCR